MLKKRIIPVLLFDDTMQVVKPVSFGRPYRRLGTMMQYIRVLENRNVDELILIDITATEQGREPNFDKLREFTAHTFMPVTYGGGVSTISHIRDALNNGADKVCIGSELSREGFLENASRKFGSQAIITVLNADLQMNGEPFQTQALAQIYEQLGAGEILLTDTYLDGTMKGYNLELIELINGVTKIPIIANGGCGSPEHMAQALDAGASAVAAGSMFLYTEHTPRSCAKYLSEQGHQVRI